MTFKRTAECLKRKAEELNERIPYEKEFNELSEDEKATLNDDLRDEIDELTSEIEDVQAAVIGVLEMIKKPVEPYERKPGKNWADHATIILDDAERTAYEYEGVPIIRPDGFDDFGGSVVTDADWTKQGGEVVKGPEDPTTASVENAEVVVAHDNEVLFSGVVDAVAFNEDSDGEYVDIELE